MSKICWLVFFLVLSSLVDFCLTEPPNVCAHNAYPPPDRFKAPEYDVDLDLPPEQRWTRLARDNKEKIKDIIQDTKALLKEFHVGFLAKLVDKLSFLDERLPSPYKEEIKSIANETGLVVGEIFVLNIGFELSAFCTSIVAQDGGGKLYHARNLDLGIEIGYITAASAPIHAFLEFLFTSTPHNILSKPLAAFPYSNRRNNGQRASAKNQTCLLANSLRAATVNLNWKKGGKIVFKSANYVGYIGVFTAVKQGRFTFSVNSRLSINGGYVGLFEWILNGKGRFMGFLSREMMENAESFEEAVAMLKTPQLVAPGYYVLGGNTSGQGIVITRSRQASGTDIWKMSDQTAGQWFIVETNSDHWKKPGVRRALAKKCLTEMTQKNVSLSNLFDVLSSKPVKNSCTTYTTLMQVDQGRLETWIRY